MALCFVAFQIIQLEQRLQDQLVVRGALEKALLYRPSAISLSNDTSVPKVNPFSSRLTWKGRILPSCIKPGIFYNKRNSGRYIMPVPMLKRYLGGRTMF